MEYTALTLAHLHTLFGRDDAQIVEGETKLSKLSGTVDISSHHPYFDTEITIDDEANFLPHDAQTDNLKKLFIDMTKAVRVVIVKLADR